MPVRVPVTCCVVSVSLFTILTIYKENSIHSVCDRNTHIPVVYHTKMFPTSIAVLNKVGWCPAWVAREVVTSISRNWNYVRDNPRQAGFVLQSDLRSKQVVNAHCCVYPTEKNIEPKDGTQSAFDGIIQCKANDMHVVVWYER